MTARLQKIAILQSNYIPWKGYFDIIRSVDLFIVYDDVQYTRRDWRNRNQIKTAQGLKWLTIPVKSKGNYTQRICDTEIHGNAWAEQHWKTLVSNYSKSPFFKEYNAGVKAAYEKAARLGLLSEVNLLFIKEINRMLGINTKISFAQDFLPEGRKEDRILSICKNCGASVYLTGPAGLNYLNSGKFKKEGIEIAVADYSSYPEYPQRFGQFVHNVSVLDIIFNTGRRAPEYMKSFL